MNKNKEKTTNKLGENCSRVEFDWIGNYLELELLVSNASRCTVNRLACVRNSLKFYC